MNSSDPIVCLKLRMARSVNCVVAEDVILNLEEIADVADTMLLSKAVARESDSE